MNRRSAIAASAFCIFAMTSAAAPTARAEPSAIVQYSADIPSAGEGDPSGGGFPRLPTVSPEVFERVPRSDVYALSQVALSPELGGYGGIAGITAPAYDGPGQSYPDESVNVTEAITGSLGNPVTLLMVALAAAMLAAALAARRAEPGEPSTR